MERTEKPCAKKMPDIQNEADTRSVPLQKVGVKGVKYPVQVLDKKNRAQHTTATVDLFVNLPHSFKGTHMSRFIEIFHKYHTDVSLKHFFAMLQEIREKLDSERSYQYYDTQPLNKCHFHILLKKKLLLQKKRE